MGILTIGISGLHAAQYGLRTAGHNITNASTDGYSRQRIQQTTFDPMSSSAGFLGQGTNVTTVRRIFNEHLNQQLLTAGASAAEMSSYHSQISQIDNLFADPTVGLSPALTDFFKAVQEMTAHPASVPARQAMLSASQSMAARFGLLDQRLTEIRDGVNGMITSEVAEINSFAREIADINGRIMVAQSTGWNQPPNDLLDQRDRLVRDLNNSVRATVINQDDSSFSVFIGNGQPLVVGAYAFEMTAMSDSADLNRTVVALQSPGGSPVLMPETMLTGGALGGLLAFRRDSLDAAQNGLGRIALTLAQNFNVQHRLGQDLNGALGGDYFDMSRMGPSVLAHRDNSNPLLAPTATISDYANLSASDYQLTYNGANFSLLKLADGSVSHFAALPQTIDGITLAAGSWTPAAGDSFLIQPTRNGAKNIALALVDPRQIAAAAPIRTGAELDNSGTAKIDLGGVTSVASLPTIGSPITLTYDAGSNSFSGFPAGTTVTITPPPPPLPPVPVNYPIAALTTPVPYTSGATIEFNGLKLTITGTPADNDSFTIERNSSGVSDNRNGNLLAALQTQNTMSGGTATYQSSYAAIVAQVGNKTREVEITGQAQESLLERTQALRDEVSGVNLDEEAASLLRYQQAYQAAAKVIGIAGSLFDEILAAVR